MTKTRSFRLSVSDLDWLEERAIELTKVSVGTITASDVLRDLIKQARGTERIDADGV